ncbi:tetratricopeptide repeat protein [Gelidibacter mesophilus]|uniref:type IX secretion system periplasmic lipoprotein PorW/SprE n=1 Tax=Gelidibacter mesophilus TaxID=169050 RepID=UPI001FDECC4C|nr:hypothetical protein [Gelidibacter mesophilus]
MNPIQPTLRTFLKSMMFLVFAALIVTSCSRKKDTFINRNFHALGTEYNILYNGNIALENGRASVDDAFTDNYWELLPVERMETTDDFTLPGQSKNSDFERAEEKAIKAVQKHGMNINGKEYNPQIDEAYLLLGKARYFDQRFIPAVEAFNYILFKYPASDKINEAKIWREKTNMRLENNELAIKNLKRLLRLEQLDDQNLADATATLAQAYINIQEKDSALAQLAIAAAYTKKNNEKARYNYIRGQLYNEFGHKDSANIAFDKVMDLHRKVPRAYYIHAHLAKAINFDLDLGDVVAFSEYLKELEEDRENRPFLDKIYYRVAEFHKKSDRDSLAIVYYNKSLRASSSDRHLRAMDYMTLGDMSFDRSEYKTAGAYYDSTMTNMVINSKPYRTIKRKRENLEDVIYYENVALVNDSILDLVNLSEADRIAIFTSYTDKLKAEADDLKKQEETAQRNESSGIETFDKTSNRTGLDNMQPSSGITPPGGANQSFYFYNPTTVAYGKNEFLKIWGDRSLKDNWRLSSTRSNALTVQNNDLAVDASDNERFDPAFYVSQIPTDQKVIDSIIKDRNYAYYQLGVIYKEKFNENILAKDKLKALLNNNPEERLVLPAKYNLYKTYVLLGETNAAEQMKQDIIANNPESRYAAILLNPKSEMSKDENSPESIYERTYASYEAQKFQEVIDQSDAYILEFQGEPIVPKFEILKASAKGRLFGFEAYKEGVNYVALNYPNSEEGKRAQEIINNVIPVLSKREFQDNEIGTRFNVLYQFDHANNEDVDAFIKKLNDEVTQIRYYDLSVSKDLYDKNTIFVVVHGLKSIQGARGFADLLQERKANITRPYIAISSPNYEIVQRHKNLNDYLKSQ